VEMEKWGRMSADDKWMVDAETGLSTISNP